MIHRSARLGFLLLCVTGCSGIDGSPGDPGAQGLEGPSGKAGDVGPQGPQGISGASLGFPAGSVIAFAGKTAPTGWLFCDGKAVSKDTYKDLFAAIADAYGPATSTSFTLPDMRGRSTVGVGTRTGDVGADDGRAEAARTVEHVHDVNITTSATGNHHHTFMHGIGRTTTAFLPINPGDGYFAQDGSFLEGTGTRNVPLNFYNTGETTGTLETWRVHTSPTGQHTHAVDGPSAATKSNYVVMNYIIKY